jgi:acetyltransferase-like isoleucine patch superfamily enzyme
MHKLMKKYINWQNSRKFAKVGKRCRFYGTDIEVEGHVEAGDNVHIRDHCIFRTRKDGKIIFKDRSMVSWYVIIESSSIVEIGENTGLAENVIIRDGTHMIYGTKEHWRFTPHIIKPTIIGPNCWIGSRAYISYGVTIGEGAVVGVGSVVTKDIGPYEVWAGSPAKYIAHRTDDVPPQKLAEAEELLKLQGIRHDRRMDHVDDEV